MMNECLRTDCCFFHWGNSNCVYWKLIDTYLICPYYCTECDEEKDVEE